MALQLLSHGEPQWDTKVNALIEEVNTNANMTWTPITSDGMVFQNGFSGITDPAGIMNGYQYIQFNGWKLVHLKIDVTLNSAPSATQEVTAVTVPDAISFPDFIEWSESSKYRLSVSDTRFRVSVNATADWWTGAGSHYTAGLLYPHFD